MTTARSVKARKRAVAPSRGRRAQPPSWPTAKPGWLMIRCCSLSPCNASASAAFALAVGRPRIASLTAFEASAVPSRSRRPIAWASAAASAACSTLSASWFGEAGTRLRRHPRAPAISSRRRSPPPRRRRGREPGPHRCRRRTSGRPLAGRAPVPARPRARRSPTIHSSIDRARRESPASKIQKAASSSRRLAASSSASGVSCAASSASSPATTGAPCARAERAASSNCLATAASGPSAARAK